MPVASAAHALGPWLCLVQGATRGHGGQKMVVFTKPELRDLSAPIAANPKAKAGGRGGGQQAAAGGLPRRLCCAVGGAQGSRWLGSAGGRRPCMGGCRVTPNSLTGGRAAW